MKARCLNPAHSRYPYYGGRGITIDECWFDFAAFRRDMGEPPSGCSLDRIDVNRGYSKSNCRWASKQQQAQNKRSVRLYDYEGQMQCIAEIARLCGVPYLKLRRRLLDGWALDRATHSEAKNGTPNAPAS
jgi:hypothetical protein